MTFSKIKKICSLALIPRLLRDEVTLTPRKLGKRPLDGFWKMSKSSDSKDQEAECEKCKKIIEMVFGRKKPDNFLKQVETNIEDMQMHKIQKVVNPSITLNKKSNEDNTFLTMENTNKNSVSPEKLSPESATDTIPKNPSALPLQNILHSTTAKTTEEQLAQKLETIDEPGLVEAATPKTDGFNTIPKMLGEQENILDNKKSLCTKVGPEEAAIEEIAKKCLGIPPDKIDERILAEMKCCGMLGRGRKKQSKRSSYHAMKCNQKSALLESESEESALHNKNQFDTGCSLPPYPPIRYHNLNCTQRPENVYPSYFRNVPFGSIGNRHLNKKTDVENNITKEHQGEKTTQEDITTLEKEKCLLVCSDKSAIADSDAESSTINDQTINKTELTEGVISRTFNIEEENPKEIIENLEVEVEETRLTASETERLGIPGESEVDPDFHHRHTKQEILLSNRDDKHEYFVFANSDPPDWNYRSDLNERSMSSPNTAISGTYPPKLSAPGKKHQTDQTDTSISAKQNPSEYFDLTQCNLKFHNYVHSPSEIRLLAAYNQYSIITETDEEAEDSENVLYSTKTSEILPDHVPMLKFNPEIEIQELPKPINKDLSKSPMPELKDLEENLTLTELLRRVRKRNRLQSYREYAFKAMEAAEPIKAHKCPPPPDKGSSKTLGPGPCKPKPKPKPKPACPPPCPPPCKPKDPCAKCTKTSIIGDTIKEAFTLVLQVAFKPALASPNLSYTSNAVEPLRWMLNDECVSRTQKLVSFFLSNSLESLKKGFGNDDFILARDYEPWSPIPSWPIPKKEEKRPFVCPKEGCKLIPPPRLDSPCKEKPCLSFPKKTFSLIEFSYEPLYLYIYEF